MSEHDLLGAHRIPLPRLLFGSLGGAVAWTLHHLVSYFLVALGCSVGWAGVEIALAAATLVFGGMAAASGWVAYRGWRIQREHEDWIVSLGEARVQAAFLMMAGMCAAALFLLVILLNGLSPLFVPTCA